MHASVHYHRNLVFDSKGYREPVQLFKYGAYMLGFRRLRDETGRRVLYLLESFDMFLRQVDEQRVTIIQSTY